MSFPHPDLIEENPRSEASVTDNYTHPGWNSTQAFTVIGLTAALILALVTAQCTKTRAEGNSFPKQSLSEKVTPKNSLNQ